MQLSHRSHYRAHPRGTASPQRGVCRRLGDGRASVRRQRLPALDPDNATVLVAGGTGVGLDTVKLLKDMGSWAYMMPTPDVQKKLLEDMMVVVVKGDLTDDQKLKSTLQNIDGLEAVVAAGDPKGSLSLMRAAAEAEVQRFVLLLTDDSAASQLAEQELQSRSEGLEYVIIKAGELITEPATDCGAFSEEPVSGVMHREDVAQLMIKALFSDKPKNKVLYAADQSKAKYVAAPEKVFQPFEV